ncbi:M23 family metallopeptidase [Glutamicibacter sp.]|uniref:M23 family metallopeptidase n=1 Tax=Glutamicibacter sp. TaxID=1931995 RepID=UPI002FE2E759
MNTKVVLLRITRLLMVTVSVALASFGMAPLHQSAPLVPVALSTSNGWRWPLAGEPKIVEPFDKPAENWLPGHRGVDLGASEGDRVFAPRQGKITFASTVVDRPVMVIDHGNGFKTSLEPVSAEVKVGDWVQAGAHVGNVATGAHCSSRCIHWGVRLNGEYIDPVLLIRDLRPSILLPLNQ